MIETLSLTAFLETTATSLPLVYAASLYATAQASLNESVIDWQTEPPLHCQKIWQDGAALSQWQASATQTTDLGSKEQ